MCTIAQLCQYLQKKLIENKIPPPQGEDRHLSDSHIKTAFTFAHSCNSIFDCVFQYNLAKIDDGHADSPTVMVGDKQQNKTRQLGKDRGILKPSWAFVETKIVTKMNIYNATG